MPDDLQDAYRLWRERTAKIIFAAEKTGAGEAYRQLIDNELDLPPLPMVLQNALFPHSGKRFDSVYHEYQAMLEG